MGTVNPEDIRGYFVGSELVCLDCVENEEANDALGEDILTQDQIEAGDELFFCDRCKKRIG